MKRLMILGVFLCCIGLLTGCSKQAITNQPEPKEQNSITNLYEAKEEQSEVKKAMEEEKLSNVVGFFRLVNRFNQDVGNDCGLVSKWTPFDEVKINEDHVKKQWEKANEDKIDINSRMVAFSLLKDLIKTKGKEEAGSYLVLDEKELEQNSDYRYLKKSKKDYTALYNEVSVEKEGSTQDMAKQYQIAWKQRGVEFPSGNVSLISVVVYDFYEKVLHITQAGVLLKQKDGSYYYVEKLDANLQYQVSYLPDKKALNQLILSRKMFQEENQKIKPFVLENDKLIE